MDIRIIAIGAISCAIFAGGCNTACNVDPKGALDELMPVPVKVEAAGGMACSSVTGKVSVTVAPVPGARKETADEAYKKGVEMTMNQLVSIFTGLGVEIFGNVGETFDPNIHNAVMHTEDESVEENTITQVFQKGFKLGEKIVRFAMVQVAN